jgi:hypothetical protein
VEAEPPKKLYYQLGARNTRNYYLASTDGVKNLVAAVTRVNAEQLQTEALDVVNGWLLPCYADECGGVIKDLHQNTPPIEFVDHKALPEETEPNTVGTKQWKNEHEKNTVQDDIHTNGISTRIDTEVCAVIHGNLKVVHTRFNKDEREYITFVNESTESLSFDLNHDDQRPERIDFSKHPDHIQEPWANPPDEENTNGKGFGRALLNAVNTLVKLDDRNELSNTDFIVFGTFITPWCKLYKNRVDHYTVRAPKRQPDPEKTARWIGAINQYTAAIDDFMTKLLFRIEKIGKGTDSREASYTAIAETLDSSRRSDFTELPDGQFQTKLVLFLMYDTDQPPFIESTPPLKYLDEWKDAVATVFAQKAHAHWRAKHNKDSPNVPVPKPVQHSLTVAANINVGWNELHKYWQDEYIKVGINAIDVVVSKSSEFVNAGVVPSRAIDIPVSAIAILQQNKQDDDETYGDWSTRLEPWSEMTPEFWKKAFEFFVPLTTTDPSSQDTVVEAPHDDGDFATWWEEDKKDLLLHVVKRVRDTDKDTARDYLQYVGNHPGGMALQPANRASLDAWRSAFASSSAVDEDVRDALLEFWTSLLAGLMEMWGMNASVSAYEVSLRTQMLEMAAFADKELAPANEVGDPGSIRRRAAVVKLTGEVMRWANVRAGPAEKAKLYAASSVWSTLGDGVEDDTADLRSTCGSDYTHMRACRDAKMSTLRMFRERIESALAYVVAPNDSSSSPTVFGRSGMVHRVPLHEVSDHLFVPRTYAVLRPEIEGFMQMVDDGRRKDPARRLLMKRFENRALVELYNRFVEMIEDARLLNRLLEGKTRAAGDKETREAVVRCLENLEWACERTWQQEFTHDDLNDRARWIDGKDNYRKTVDDDGKTVIGDDGKPVYEYDEKGKLIPELPVDTGRFASADRNLTFNFEKGNEIAALQKTPDGAIVRKMEHMLPAEHDGLQGTKVVGGSSPSDPTPAPVAPASAPPAAPPASSIDASLPDDPADRVVSSDAYRAVLRSRTIVRKIYADLRAALAAAAAATLPKGSTLDALFMRACVLPRVQAVLSAVQGAIKGYMTSQWEPDESRQDDFVLSHEERRRGREAHARSRASSGDALGYLVKEESTQVMYALKIIRFFCQLGALWAARRAYADAYTSYAVSEGGASSDEAPAGPPSLTKMLLLFLGIDATLQLLTLLALVVVSHFGGDRDAEAGKRGRASSQLVIDDEFLQAFLADYFLTTAGIATFGVLVARLMRRKAYFDLAGAGSKAAAGYGAVMAGACAVIGAVPFFML